MSNNIYDILKKIENLETPRQNLTEGKKAKPDYIDIDKDGDKKEPMKKAVKDKAKGGIAEAVARVESQLNEKYMGFKKTVAAIKKGGSAENPEAVAAAIGRKKYGKEKFQKAAAAGKKLGEDSGMKKSVIPVGVIDGPGGYEEAQKRIKDYDDGKINKDGKQLPPVEDRSKPAEKPKTKAVDESGLQAYLGKKKYGEQGMRALQQAGREGASKEKMARIRARHDKMDEGDKDIYNKGIPDQGIVGSGKPDPKERERYLDYPSYRDDQGTFYDQLGNPRANLELKKQMDKDRTYPVYEPGLPPDRPVPRPRKMKEGEYNEDMLSPKQKQFAALAKPKDKITYADKIAGAKKKNEGNKFSGNLMKARAQGLKQADLDGDGDMEKVTPGKSNMREGWEEMQKYLEKKRGPESKGGAGKKAGTRYGGSAQRDDDEDLDGEGQPTVKKKGRPKGTGGGAKHSFKKPKD